MGYTVSFLMQQKPLFHDSQNTNLSIITTRTIRVHKSLQVAVQSDYNNWPTQEIFKYVLHLWVLANP